MTEKCWYLYEFMVLIDPSPDHVQWWTIWNCSTSWIHIQIQNMEDQPKPGAPYGFSPQSKRCRPPTVGVCTKKKNQPQKFRRNLRPLNNPSVFSTVNQKISNFPNFSKISSFLGWRNRLFQAVPRFTHSIQEFVCHSGTRHEYSWNHQPVIYIYIYDII